MVGLSLRMLPHASRKGIYFGVWPCRPHSGAWPKRQGSWPASYSSVMVDLSSRMAPVNLHDPATFAAGIPHAAFAEMRAVPELAWSPTHGETKGFWSVTRHEDLVSVSRDTETYSSAVGHIQMYDIDEDTLSARASMIDMDPPVHTRLRRIVSSAFTPRRVDGYKAAIRKRVKAALDQLQADGGGDWVDIVAAPIPIGVICDLMGVPEADHGLSLIHI